jgi:hypothetical protein
MSPVEASMSVTAAEDDGNDAGDGENNRDFVVTSYRTDPRSDS